jgi:glycerol-3-phosphate cytidylyltransferase-like family protein
MAFTDLHTVLCDHLCRMLMVSAVKWVDEVISDAPYAINEEFMKKLFTEYSIDYIIHGDDPCLLPDGTDAYALAKKSGRYKQIKRTEGVSSTDIVGMIYYIHVPLFSVDCKEGSVV